MKKRGRAIIPWFLPRLQDILFISILLGGILLGPRLLNTDGDLGRHLTIGNYVIDSLKIPIRDLFSHTMQGAALTPHEWLAEVLFSLAYRLIGLNGVVFISALLIASAFTIVLQHTARASQAPLFSLAIVVLAVAASSIHWIARPHLYTILLLAIWNSRLSKLVAGKSIFYWEYPVIMLLWVNLHGGFIVGFMTWLAYLAGMLWEHRKGVFGSLIFRRLILAGVLSFAVTFLNPSGWHLWATSLGYLHNRYLVGHTQEYFSPNFHQPGTWPFLIMLLFSFLILARSRKHLSMTQTLLLVGLSAMGLFSARNIPLYAVVATPILTIATRPHLADCDRWNRFEKRLETVEHKLRGNLWSLIGIVSAVILLSTNNAVAIRNRFNVSVFPIQAVDWLENHPQQGNMFNYFPWGGYLLYRLWPEQTVFIDGQTDFYGEALTRQYEQVITLSDTWEQILEEYDVTWVIMPRDAILSRTLLDRSNWALAYEDATTVIFQIR